MHLRVWSVVFVVALVAIMDTSQGGLNVGTHPFTPPNVTRLAPGDNDGDGLPDDLDPDDDNDGIVDNSDAAPFDPLVPGSADDTPPDTTAPDQDTDDDSIPNDLDPDDNNDGSVDGPKFPPTTVPTAVPTAPVQQSPDPVATEHAGSAEPGSPPADAPGNAVALVTALPNTGSGGRANSGSLIVATFGAASLAVLSVASARKPSAR